MLRPYIRRVCCRGVAWFGAAHHKFHALTVLLSFILNIHAHAELVEPGGIEPRPKAVKAWVLPSQAPCNSACQV